MPEFEYSVKPPETKKDFIRDMQPGVNRQNQRSMTPMGFANAVYEANSNKHYELIAA